MKTRLKVLIGGIALAVGLNTANAENLLQVYKHALQADPTLKAAQADYLSVMENKPQALSALKPQVNLSGSTSYNVNHFDNSRTTPDGSYDFLNAGYNLSVSKALYHKELDAQVEQANAVVAQARSSLEVEEQSLIIRVAQAYFEYLNAQDTLKFAKAEKQAIARQLAQVKAYFEAGRSPITDVKEAQARYDAAVSAEVAAEQQLDIAREQLKAITNREYKHLAGATPNTPLTPPNPNKIEVWNNLALKNSKEIQALKHAVDVAQSEVDKQRAGKKPTVDLFAQQTGSFNSIDIDTDELDAALGVQLNVPLYTGGRIASQIRQARHSLHQARQQLEVRKRQVVQQARSAFLSVVSGIAQVKALKQSLNSSQTAAKATKAGFEVGTRTAVDVLLALRETYRAERDYSTARYNYLLNKLVLKQAAGTLSENDLAQISKVLR